MERSTFVKTRAILAINIYMAPLTKIRANHFIFPLHIAEHLLKFILLRAGIIHFALFAMRKR